MTSLVVTTPQSDESRCIWFLLLIAAVIGFVFIIWGILSNHFMSIIFGVIVVVVDFFITWNMWRSM